ncbi:MAG TPA: hypothetical protein V6D12_11130 [Candidatus Obscuribacterales bacterium]
MGLDILVQDNYYENYNTGDFYGLIYRLPDYLINCHYEFEQLSKLVGIPGFCEDNNLYEPEKVLAEIQLLKHLLSNNFRPYRLLKPEELDGTWLGFLGIRYYQKLLKPEGQIVTSWDWTEIVDGGYSQRNPKPPCTLVASQEKLHLVEASICELETEGTWDIFTHISANTFEWISESLTGDGELWDTDLIECELWEICPPMGRIASLLVADGKICSDVPKSFFWDIHCWEAVSFASVPIYAAWEEEIEELIRACNDGLREGKLLYASR